MRVIDRLKRKLSKCSAKGCEAFHDWGEGEPCSSHFKLGVGQEQLNELAFWERARLLRLIKEMCFRKALAAKRGGKNMAASGWHKLAKDVERRYEALTDFSVSGR